jgi:uncharacterized protein (TIGR00369 family)
MNDFGLHMNFYRTASGEVQSTIRIPEQFQGYPGIVHGGIIAAMLDEVSGRAVMMDEEGQPTRFLVTATLNIRYRKPVHVETDLVLKGHLVKDSGRVANVTGEIFDTAGQLLAEAESVMVNLPDGLVTVSDQESLGWRVYPDEEDAR